MMQDCDTLLMVGTNFPYSRVPARRRARRAACRSTSCPGTSACAIPMEVNLWGDAKTTLAALLPLLEPRRPIAAGRTSIAESMRTWDEVARAQAQLRRPTRSTRGSCSTRSTNGCPTTRSSPPTPGTTADWYGHHIRLGRNMMGNLSGRLATMLAAMPYAIAAKFAFPERPVVCTIGDGAFQMLGMNGLLTVKRHWQEWANPTFIVLVAPQRRPQPGVVGDARGR